LADLVSLVFGRSGQVRRKETNFAQFYNFNKEVTAVSGVIPSSDKFYEVTEETLQWKWSGPESLGLKVFHRRSPPCLDPDRDPDRVNIVHLSPHPT